MSIAHSTSINVTPVATVKQGYASLAVGGRRRKTRSSRFTCLAAVENTFILSRSLAFTDSVLEQSQIYAKQLAEKYENVSFPEIPESSLDVKRLEELSNYLNLAEEKISSNFESISATSLVSKSDLSEKVMRNLELIKASVEQNSSINKLMESSGHLVESSNNFSRILTQKLTLLIDTIKSDPFGTAEATNSLILQYLTNLIQTLEADTVSYVTQPEVLPVAAIIAGTTIGVIVGNIISWILSEEGGALPSRYDPKAIAAFFKKRPLDVLVRFSRISAEASIFYARVYLDKIQGKTAENERKRARQLVEMIARLGPTAIKVGQALSIRPDLLSLAYLEELQTLQDRVPPFSTVEAQRIIAEGLGRDPSALFSNMSPEPVAAASLGQVYKADLKETGEPVAVKVQRPGVLEEICCDLFVLRSCASILQKLPRNQSDLEAVLDNWARRFFDELDYIQEGKNAIRFAEDMKVLKNVAVPKVYSKFTSRKVLTTEWVEGEKLSESSAADLGSLVTTALNCYLIQLLESGFLHADPHPGNLLRTPDGKLCVLDYGLMTEVTEGQQYALIEYISHLVNNDFEAVANDLVVLGFIPEGSVDPSKTAAVVEPLSRVLGQLVRGGGAKYVNLAQVTDDLSQMSQEYTFVIPPYFALILRAFSVLEGIGLENDPNYSIVDQCYPYISKRLITDDSPRAREALRYFLYGKSERLNVERVENIVNGFQTFRDLMAPVNGIKDSQTVQKKAAEGVDPTAREALKLVFSSEGSYLQELLLTELVRSVDALSREAQATLWSFLLGRVPLPIPATLTVPGTWPLPLPGMLAGIIRGEWFTGRVSEDDQQQLLTIRRLWTLLEPQLSETATPASPADFTELGRDVIPLIGEMWPGVLTTGQRFIIMLLQRQALRLADDLDGSNSVEFWERDPAQLARQIQPLGFFVNNNKL